MAETGCKCDPEVGWLCQEHAVARNNYQLKKENANLRDRLARALAFLKKDLNAHSGKTFKEVLGNRITVFQPCDCSQCTEIREILQEKE